MLAALCKIWRLFVNTSTADDKYFLLNRNNLMQPIQILIYDKQNFFSQFLFGFLKSILNFKHFQKKITLIADVFSKWLTPTDLVRKLSKKNRFRSNMVSRLKRFVILTTAPLPYLLITVKTIESEKVSLSDMQNIKPFSYHIDCRWQVFLS